MEAIISFKSVSHAIRAEGALLEAGLPVTVMPMPSDVREGCGLCLRLPSDRLDEALRRLESIRAERAALFIREENGKMTRMEEENT
ncbi:MAG: DUF3343 domain-containing protein [Synergistaceae bacterium]|jgi:hypothetical protein|nr:DUF3343 domain-containing protein [Synergistaceae bacterium]